MRKTVTVCDLCEKTIDGPGGLVVAVEAAYEVHVCVACMGTPISALKGAAERIEAERRKDPVYAQQSNMGYATGYYGAAGGLKGGR